MDEETSILLMSRQTRHDMSAYASLVCFSVTVRIARDHFLSVGPRPLAVSYLWGIFASTG